MSAVPRVTRVRPPDDDAGEDRDHRQHAGREREQQAEAEEAQR